MTKYMCDLCEQGFDRRELHQMYDQNGRSSSFICQGCLERLSAPPAKEENNA